MQQKTNNLNPNQPATQHKKWSPYLRLPTRHKFIARSSLFHNPRF